MFISEDLTPVGPHLRTATAVRVKPEDLGRLVEESVREQFRVVGQAARGADVLVAGGALQHATFRSAERPKKTSRSGISDDRPLAPELEAFLADGEPPIYFGLGSMRGAQDARQLRPPTSSANRLWCNEVGPTCSSPATRRTASRSVRSTNRRCSAALPHMYDQYYPGAHGRCAGRGETADGALIA